uniref:Uncharacterized protein n=1 Tax=Helianthus annuus TaxID=4232 RepID=A0A251USX2_HELAN
MFKFFFFYNFAAIRNSNLTVSFLLIPITNQNPFIFLVSETLKYQKLMFRKRV